MRGDTLTRGRPWAFSRFSADGLCALALAIALLSAAPAEARNQVTIDIDRYVATVGDAVRITVNILVQGRGGYEQFFPPKMEGFQLEGTALTSQSYEVVNWNVRLRESRVYEATPLRAGKLVIGPAAVRVGGTTVKSNKVVLHVKAGQGRQVTPTPSDPQGSSLRQSPGKRLPSILLQASAEPNRPYVGQQVIVTWKLYAEPEVVDFAATTQPVHDDFWAEDLESIRRLRYTQEVHQNRIFRSAVVMRRALFPQKSGKLKVGPLTARIRTFSGFMGAPSVYSSGTLELDVLPLPTAQQPADFPAQNVGRFELVTSVDQEKTQIGKPLQLKVVVAGRGNIRQIELPQLKSLPGAKLYPPKVSDRLHDDRGIRGEKVAEYVIMPTRAGKLSIPALQLHYFDPIDKTYRVSTSDVQTIIVEGGATPPSSTSSPSATSPDNVLGRDIRPVRQIGPIGGDHNAKALLSTPLLIALFGLAPALLLGVGLIGTLRARLLHSRAPGTKTALQREVRSQIKAAKSALARGSADALTAALTSALFAQLTDCIDARAEGLTRSELHEAWSQHSLPAPLLSATTAQLDQLDAIRFAGSSPDSTTLAALIPQTTKLINQLGGLR
ncbi:MAG: protein BatD [Deltaproteobacteria bacterium]|nr:protein BatD [Deltaproteobacteria bacterium]